MRPMTNRQTFVWALVLAIGWVALQAWQTDERALRPLAVTGAFFFVVAFFSMRVSSRLSLWTQNRFGKTEPERAPAMPPVSTTERPEHAQRRREKRRKRSYRRKR